MARPRAKAAVRKVAERAAAAALERRRSMYAPNVIADGVRAVAIDLEDVVTPGALYWAAPFRYVIEQMAPRVCRQYELPVERAEDVGEYLIAKFNEFVVTMIERFDCEHFEAWTAAQKLRADGEEVARG